MTFELFREGEKVWLGLLTEASGLMRWTEVVEFCPSFVVSSWPPWQTARYIKRCGLDAGKENSILESCSPLTHSVDHILHQKHTKILPISHKHKTWYVWGGHLTI